MTDAELVIATYGVESLLEDVDRSWEPVDRHVATFSEISRTSLGRVAARPNLGAALRDQMTSQIWSNLLALNARGRR
jgi:hypothetical protein